MNMAGPMLNNILGGGDQSLNQSIGQLLQGEAEEDLLESESIFVKLTSQLSISEMLAIFQGNLGAVQGLSRKLKNVLLDELDNEDTPEKRRLLATREGDKFKTMLKIPD